RNTVGPSNTLKSFSCVFAILGGVAVPTQYILAQEADSGVLVGDYCTKCHNFDDYAGGIDLEGMDARRIAQVPEVGEKVIKRLRAGMMPPAGEPRPDYHVMQSWAASLERSIDE